MRIETIVLRTSYVPKPSVKSILETIGKVISGKPMLINLKRTEYTEFNQSFFFII